MKNYFTDEELKCKCNNCNGRIDLLDPKLRDILNHLREKINHPLVITSCIRCELHPIEKAKSKKGAHAYGKAVDIKATTSQEKYMIVKGAIELGINRIGYAETFIHIDLMDNVQFPKYVMWTYK